MPPGRPDERVAFNLVVSIVAFSGPSKIATGMRVLVIGKKTGLGTGIVYTGNIILAVF